MVHDYILAFEQDADPAVAEPTPLVGNLLHLPAYLRAVRRAFSPDRLWIDTDKSAGLTLRDFVVHRLAPGPRLAICIWLALDPLKSRAKLLPRHDRIDFDQRMTASFRYAFNDVHAVMAFVGAGQRDLALAVIETQQEAIARPGDNATFTSEVGLAVAQALLSFGDGDYAQAARLLRSVRSVAHRFGGSHAQRDVINLTLIEAAIRSDDGRLASALADERADRRHESPLSQLFVRRASTLAAAA